MRFCKAGILFIVFLLLSCSVKEQNLRLDEIASLMQEFPDSARIQLESYSKEELINPAIRARHALLLSETYDLCGETVTSDSLIRKAIGFYALRWTSSRHLSRAYYCLSNIYDAQGNGHKAAEAYLNAVFLNSKEPDRSEKILAFDKYKYNEQELSLLIKNKTMERRYYNQKSILLIGILFVLAVGCLLFSNLRSQKNARKDLVSALNDLQAEYDVLKEKPVKLESISEEAREKLGDRLRAIGCFLGTPPAELSGLSDSLDNIKEERKDILETVGLLFALWFPAFVNYLLDRKLTVSEVGYCALITIGIQTKTLGDIINKSSYYKISSSIRKKIGLPPNEIKLGTFLREKFSEEVE